MLDSSALTSYLTQSEAKHYFVCLLFGFVDQYVHYRESFFPSLLSLLAIVLLGNVALSNRENRLTYWTDFAPRHSWQENGCLSTGFWEGKTRCFLAAFNRCYSSLQQHFKMQIPRVYAFPKYSKNGKVKISCKSSSSAKHPFLILSFFVTLSHIFFFLTWNELPQFQHSCGSHIHQNMPWCLHALDNQIG